MINNNNNNKIYKATFALFSVFPSPDGNPLDKQFKLKTEISLYYKDAKTREMSVADNCDHFDMTCSEFAKDTSRFLILFHK